MAADDTTGVGGIVSQINESLQADAEFEQFIQDYLMEQLSADPSAVDVAMQEYLLWSMEQAMAAEEDPSLSETEIELLDDMAANAMEMFETAMASGYEENWQEMIANQTALGRLGPEGQVSSLGDYAAADVWERQQELLAQGSAQIASQRLQAEMDILQENKQLDFAGQQLAASGIGVAGQYSLQDDPLNIVASIYGGQADRAQQLAIAQSQASAQQTAAQYQMFGNLAGMGTAAAIFSSKRHKKNIVPLWVDLNGLQVVSFEYTDKALKDYPDKTLPGKQVGYLAEDVAKVFPNAVIFDDTGRPDAINYGKLLGEYHG